jgi:hypothetical protein
MRHIRVSLVLGLAVGLALANGAKSEPTPNPPAGCTPDYTLQINDSMPTQAPDIPTMTGIVAWKSAQDFTIAFLAQNGNNPYPNNKSTTEGSDHYWWSCATAAGVTWPISYTITFRTNGKQVNGHIIIKKKKKKD